jgi:hypothetical protein
VHFFFAYPTFHTLHCTGYFYGRVETLTSRCASASGKECIETFDSKYYRLTYVWSRIMLDNQVGYVFDNHDGCTQCPAGTSFKQGDKVCKPCDPGFFSDAPASLCKACPIGQMSNADQRKGVAATGCVDCPVGTYQDMTGSTSCKPCPKGFYQNRKGKTSCYPCLPGSFASKEGLKYCDPAPAGSYTQHLSNTSGIVDFYPCP